MFNDLRQFLDYLAQTKRLREINECVDPKWELGAVCSETYKRDGYGLLFRNVKGFQTPLAAGLFGCKLDIYSEVLGAGSPEFKSINERWQKIFSKPLPPAVIEREKAPCKEVEIDESAVNLYQDPFPVPIWHYLDGGPMLGTLHAVITKDPESGWINIGAYRNQILSKNVLGCTVLGDRHIGMNFAKWQQKGMPMPIAIAIGLDPYLLITTVTAIPAQVDEYDIAGAIKGAPIEVVKADTSDLLVPANAEIVIEGELSTDEWWPEQEGPFGEFTGFLGEPKKKRFLKVKKVTHRCNPIFLGVYVSGRAPSEHSMMLSIGRSSALYDHLIRAGCPGIKDVCVTPAGGSQLHAVVSISKQFPGHARCVMALCWGYSLLFCKHVVIVDEDIDVWDSQEVEWAIATRVQASRDVTIISGAHSTFLDPSQVPSRRGWSDWMGIDATSPVDEYKRENAEMPPYADKFPEELLVQVKEKFFKTHDRGS